jgi:DNA replication initiation complex subunit (GINS family)
MAEINITYETLFELERRERSREELQELTQTFLPDVADYFQAKEQILSSQRQQGTDEARKTEVQLESAQKVLKKLFEKREKKILLMALSKSRTGSDIFDTSRMLPEEKELYDEILTLILLKRRQITSLQKEAKHPQQEEKQSESKVVRFLQPVPRFLGRELEPYGPFDKEQVASLPTAIAQVLIAKQRAEEIG